MCLFGSVFTHLRKYLQLTPSKNIVPFEGETEVCCVQAIWGLPTHCFKHHLFKMKEKKMVVTFAGMHRGVNCLFNNSDNRND